MNTLDDATGDLGDPGALRARLDRDSYVYLPGLLDRERVLEARAEIVAALDELGWLREGSDPSEAVPSDIAIPEGREPLERYFEMYARTQAIQSFHELAIQAPLQNVLRDLFGETVLTHPMKILRVGVPTPDRWTTPSHQDFPIIDGTVDVITTWIPIGDVVPELGGLKILPGSATGGSIPPVPTAGIGGISVGMDEDDERFATAEYRAGDVLLFHSLTVHGALPNTSDHIRLSADFRFQALSEPMREHWLQPHYHPHIPGWDGLCEGWTSMASVTAPAELNLRTGEERAPADGSSLIRLDAGAASVAVPVPAGAMTMGGGGVTARNPPPRA